YDTATGGDPTFIKTLNTPYGASNFTDGQDYNANTRWLVIKDAQGITKRIEFDGNAPPASDAGAPPAVPTGITFDASTLSRNNSYVWDGHAYAIDGNGAALNYADAKQYHWLANRAGVAAPVLGAVKAPNENFVFYNYPGQSATGNYNVVGTFDQPIAAGRILDASGTVQLSTATYNPNGYPLTINDAFRVAGNNNTGRGLRFTYAANNIDLTEVDRQTATGPTWTPVAQFGSYVNHLPQTFTDAALQVTNATYNGAGQVLTVKNAYAQTTTLNYTAVGAINRLTGVTNANNKPQATLHYACDASGAVNCDLPDYVLDSEGRKHTF